MKDLVVAVMALLLGHLGPQRYQPSPFDPLWLLGMVVLVAYSFGQMARGLRLPSMVGWIGAGLVMGSGGLGLVVPQASDMLRLVRDAAVLWIAFQVGLQVWPLAWLDWKRAGVLLASTLGVCATVTAGVGFFLSLPWLVALLLGALSCAWGPFTGAPTTRRRQALQVGLVGVAFSTVVLSAVLLWLQLEGALSAATASFVARFWLSCALGAASAGAVRFFSLLPGSIRGLLFSLFFSCFVLAALFSTLQLHPLPFGFAAGAVLARQSKVGRRLRYVLFRVGPIPLLLYFSLLGAQLDVRALALPAPGLPLVMLISISALLVLRGVVPAVYLRFSTGRAQRDLGWQLLPRGVLVFELCYAPTFALLDGLSGEHAVLLRHFVLSDILVSTLLYVMLARAAQYISERVHSRRRPRSA